MFRVILGLGVSALAISLSLTPAKAVEVYLFKGAGDFSFINEKMHFSRGLERIRDELQKDGIHAVVRRHGNTAAAMREIKKRKPESVAFVGHSMGALASMSMAKRMKALGIRVAYVGTLDIPGPIGVAGSNVEKAENYYSITPIYGLLTNAKKHKDAKNIHVFGTHTTMDDSKKVFNGVVSAIREIHAAEQEALQPDPVIEPQEELLVQAPSNDSLNTVEVIAAGTEKTATNELTVASRTKPIQDLNQVDIVPTASVRAIENDDVGAPINLLARLPNENGVRPSIEQPAKVVVSEQVLEKLTRKARLLDRVRSVLRKNGSRNRNNRLTVER